MAKSSRGGSFGFLWRRGLLPDSFGCGDAVGFCQTCSLVPVDALGFLFELSSQERGSFGIHVGVNDLGALGRLLWRFLGQVRALLG